MGYDDLYIIYLNMLNNNCNANSYVGSHLSPKIING